MALFRRLFNWRMPAGLVEISGNILGACPLTESPIPFFPETRLRRLYCARLGLGKACPPARSLLRGSDLFVRGFLKATLLGKSCSPCVQGGSSSG
jgi:hypothetical protein